MAAVNGTRTPRLTDFMAERAKGVVALIIISHCYVQNAGKVRNGRKADSSPGTAANVRPGAAFKNTRFYYPGENSFF